MNLVSAPQAKPDGGFRPDQRGRVVPAQGRDVEVGIPTEIGRRNLNRLRKLQKPKRILRRDRDANLTIQMSKTQNSALKMP